MMLPRILCRRGTRSLISKSLLASSEISPFKCQPALTVDLESPTARCCSSLTIDSASSILGKAILVIMPMMSPSMRKGTLSRWTKHQGDPVDEYEVVFEAGTTTLTEEAYKVDDFAGTVTMQVEAAEEGFMVRHLVGEGGEVKVGTPVALMCESEEDIPRISAALDEQGGKVAQSLARDVNVYKDEGHGWRVLSWQCYLKESKKKPTGGCM